MREVVYCLQIYNNSFTRLNAGLTTIYLTAIALGEVREGVDTPIPQEGPPATYPLATCKVNLDDTGRLTLVKLYEELSLRASDEAPSPEGDPTGLPRRVGLVSDTVHRDYR